MARSPSHHIDTFAVLSGDSDFSPLVAKLKEAGKTVIGVGMKESTSSLLAEVCDEFIFWIPKNSHQVSSTFVKGNFLF